MCLRQFLFFFSGNVFDSGLHAGTASDQPSHASHGRRLAGQRPAGDRHQPRVPVLCRQNHGSVPRQVNNKFCAR